MADEILNVRADTYRACILLDALPTMTLEKFHKLVRLMTTHEWENEAALEQLGRWLEAQKAATEADWKHATFIYHGCARRVNPRSRTKLARAILAENKSCAEAVRITASNKTKAAKMAEIYHNLYR